MEWLHVLTIIFGTLAWVLPLIIWMRSDTAAQITALRSDTAAQIDAIRQDIKDFHGRLCGIEERRLKRDGGGDKR